MKPLGLNTLLHRVREIADSVIVSNALELDENAGWPAKNMAALMDADLGALVIPKVHGGHGHGLYALTRICEIIGRVCPSTAICYGMHSVGASVISANPNVYQKEHFITPICEGKHITTLSLSEPGTGAHFYLPQTKIVAGKDSYIANGVKTFVTNGGHADSYVISGVNFNKESDLDEFSCFVLPAETSGMTWGEEWDGLGMRGNSSRTLTLNRVKINTNCLLGNEGDQFWYMFHVVAPFFLTAMSGTYSGLASEAFSIACEHIKSRSHSHNDRALASVSLVQHRIASLWGKLKMMEQFVHHSAKQFDSGSDDALLNILTAKAEVADTAVFLVNEIMTLAGGIGYARKSKLGKMLRDVRAAHVMSPTTDLLRLWIGRMILEQPILTDE